MQNCLNFEFKHEEGLELELHFINTHLSLDRPAAEMFDNSDIDKILWTSFLLVEMACAII